MRKLVALARRTVRHEYQLQQIAWNRRSFRWLTLRDPSQTICGFLSHELSGDGVEIAPAAIARMKKRSARIMYSHLLLQLKRQQFNANRLGPGFRDWDLVTCVNELRRYIYGRITEASLSSGLSGSGRINTTRCALSFFPLVDTKGSVALKQLDGWLVDALERCYAKRCEILHRYLGGSGRGHVSRRLQRRIWRQFCQSIGCLGTRIFATLPKRRDQSIRKFSSL